MSNLLLNEITELTNMVLKEGAREAYKSISDKCFLTARNHDSLDEYCMNIHDKAMQLSREENPKFPVNVLYQISSIFRKIAHDLNRMYSINGREEEISDRFLKIVHSNTDLYEEWR